MRVEFAYDGGGLGKGGTVHLFVDGSRSPAGAGRRDRADAVLGRRDHRCRHRHRHAGERRLRPEDSVFTGRVRGSRSTSATPPRADHLITAEERYRIAMARQ